MLQQLPAELAARKFHLLAIAQPGAHCKAFGAEADTECIAHSGVIPEALFMHDPPPSLQSFIQKHGKLPEEKRHDDLIYHDHHRCLSCCMDVKCGACTARVLLLLTVLVLAALV